LFSLFRLVLKRYRIIPPEDPVTPTISRNKLPHIMLIKEMTSLILIVSVMLALI
jgi:hypothetical protein